MSDRSEWTTAKNELVAAVRALGFPEELGELVARQLGSPKAMSRMLAYLHYVKPRKAELIVDEMLAICSDIESWKAKKASEHANASSSENVSPGASPASIRSLPVTAGFAIVSL